MVNRSKVIEMAKLLNLQALATTNYIKDLKDEDIIILENAFAYELDSRKRNVITRNRKDSNLLNTNYNLDNINKGRFYQIDKLSKGEFVNTFLNLYIHGDCRTGKTSLATHIGEKCLENQNKVYYIKQDELLIALNNSSLAKPKNILNKIEKSDLVIIDEFMYLNIDKQEAYLLYKLLTKINDITSFIFISNKVISDLSHTCEDEYIMNLIIERVLKNSEIVML